MIEKIVAWDRSATLVLNSLHSPATDAFWSFMSDKWVWAPLYAAFIALLIWKLGWKRGLVMIAATILCVTCIDQLCNLVKWSVGRLRPCCDPEMIERGLHVLEPHHPAHPYGFFSGHASNAMGFAVCMILAFRPWKNAHPEMTKIYRTGSIILIVWALLVGISRIFVAKHFLGDITVGFVIGALLAWLWISIGNWVIRRYHLR
ncbi:MAG: phosphatase PAP2 family protein [Bacteroidales bacterium]|nr:phosphatase PAP2 family protein [Bacteroidales bacterium]